MPKAYGYCRLSPRDIRVACEACRMEFRLPVRNTSQREFDCDFCGHTYVVSPDDPLSIQSQADMCYKLAEQKLPSNVDPTLRLVVDVDVSAKVPIRDRENGRQLMLDLRTGDWLFIPILDRGFRNLGDWCNQADFFVRNKINVVLGDFPDFNLNDPMARLMLNMMAMFAEYDSLQKGRHTKRAHDKNRALGKPISSAVPHGFNLCCTECDHIYSYEQSRKGQSCPGCKTPRNGHTKHIPDQNEQQIMWRILWERSPHCHKDWDLLVHGLNEDGIRSRTGAKLTMNWARTYYRSAVKLWKDGELLEKFRPPKMENFTIDHLPKLPKGLDQEHDSGR